MNGIILIGYIRFSGRLYQFMFVHYKDASETGGDPKLPVSIFKQVISPVGIISSCIVYDVVMYKLMGIIVIAVDTSVCGYP